MYQRVTALNKLLNLNNRIRGISGGTSASKTISIIMWLIDRAQASREPEIISIVSETMPHLKKGAIRDFLSIMGEHNYFNEARWNKTESIYTFESGSIIEFFSADQPARVRGPRRDILFINEANNIDYETYTQLEIRTKKIIWLDWNPVAEFWFYTDILNKRDDVDFLTLTYKDNEALEKSIIDTIEKRKHNINWWRVYGLGELGEAEGRIYTGWNTELEAIPQQAQLIRYGLDFGYTNDPTVIVGIYKWDNSFIFDEVTYLKRLSNRDIADIFDNQPRKLVVADSEDPKSIDEIRSYNIPIIGAKKGKDSINQGIQYVQSLNIFVTKRSVNIIKEYRNYLWVTDKEGKIINEAQDFLNHAMDAIRYGMDGYRPKTYIQTTNFGGVKPYYQGLPG